jgi:hypothetical protein
MDFVYHSEYGDIGMDFVYHMSTGILAAWTLCITCVKKFQK